eukprot:g29295.t1
MSSSSPCTLILPAPMRPLDLDPAILGVLDELDTQAKANKQPDFSLLNKENLWPLQLPLHGGITVRGVYEGKCRTGDDLLVDATCVRFARAMDTVLSRPEAPDARVAHYEVMPLQGRPKAGFIEMMEKMTPMAEVLPDSVAERMRGGDRRFAEMLLRKTPEGSQQAVRDRVARFYSGLCAYSYLLGIHDRHQDNMLVVTGHCGNCQDGCSCACPCHEVGKIANIDNGFVFGEMPYCEQLLTRWHGDEKALIPLYSELYYCVSYEEGPGRNAIKERFVNTVLHMRKHEHQNYILGALGEEEIKQFVTGRLLIGVSDEEAKHALEAVFDNASERYFAHRMAWHEARKRGVKPVLSHLAAHGTPYMIAETAATKSTPYIIAETAATKSSETAATAQAISDGNLAAAAHVQAMAEGKRSAVTAQAVSEAKRSAAAQAATESKRAATVQGVAEAKRSAILQATTEAKRAAAVQAAAETKMSAVVQAAAEAKRSSALQAISEAQLSTIRGIQASVQDVADDALTAVGSSTTAQAVFEGQRSVGAATLQGVAQAKRSAAVQVVAGAKRAFLHVLADPVKSNMCTESLRFMYVTGKRAIRCHRGNDGERKKARDEFWVKTGKTAVTQAAGCVVGISTTVGVTALLALAPVSLPGLVAGAIVALPAAVLKSGTEFACEMLIENQISSVFTFADARWPHSGLVHPLQFPPIQTTEKEAIILVAMAAPERRHKNVQKVYNQRVCHVQTDFFQNESS